MLLGSFNLIGLQMKDLNVRRKKIAQNPKDVDSNYAHFVAV